VLHTSSDPITSHIRTITRSGGDILIVKSLLRGLDINLLRVIIGLAIGLAIGLMYTWVINPVELVNTHPALLRSDHRTEWVRLVALSYVADGDAERAQARLAGLDDEDVASAMQALIEYCAADGRPADTLRRLTTLARALDVHTPAMWVYMYTPTSPPPAHTSTPSPSPTPTVPPTHTPTPYTLTPLVTPTRKPTRTPRPPTPTPAPLPPFQLVEKEQICEPGATAHIEVVVKDERGAELPGVEVWLMWPGGADRAITGLKPQSGAGYVDFDAERSVPPSDTLQSIDYMLGISELGMPLVTDLQIVPCPSQKGKDPQLGSWRIVLKRRSPETD
jgi:hypothetical protein